MLSYIEIETDKRAVLRVFWGILKRAFLSVLMCQRQGEEAIYFLGRF